MTENINLNTTEMEWVGNWSKLGCDLHRDASVLYDYNNRRRFTYADLDHRANVVSKFLVEELHISKGKIICVLSKNRFEYIDLFFAAGKIGGVLKILCQSFNLCQRGLNYDRKI